jgi:predicted ester cyclase
MTRNEIMEFFARRDDAWQRHDLAALTTDHTEDGDVESPLWGNLKGHSAIQKVYKEWFSSFPDVEYTTEHLVIDGNRAVQFVKMVGVQNGDFCGLAPTGKRFEVRCAFLFFFSGRKVAREIRVYDFAGVLLQLGVLKAKPTF